MPGLNFFSSFLSAFYFTNIRPLLPASHTQTLPGRLIQRAHTAQIIKFFIKKFFSKCDRIRRKLRIWSHLLKKFLTENFIFCAMSPLHTAGLKPGTFGFRVQIANHYAQRPYIVFFIYFKYFIYFYIFHISSILYIFTIYSTYFMYFIYFYFWLLFGNLLQSSATALRNFSEMYRYN